jgi:hypothetical protein
MIGDKQRQAVDVGGLAIQSGHDTTINAGLSTDQIRAIIECVADQLPKYAAIAATVVDARLKDFEDRVVSRMQTDSSANTKAFQDPDFQYLLRGAQHAYARSGDKEIAEHLTELIAERSKASSRTRKALSLNRAIETAPLLTENEIAELSIGFIIRRVLFGSLNTPQQMADVLRTHVDPFIDKVSNEDNSYIYMESLGCGKLSMGSCELARALGESYPWVLGELPEYNSFKDIGNSDTFNAIVNSGILNIDASGHVRQAIRDEEEFVQAVNRAGISSENVQQIFQATRPTTPTKDEVITKLEPFYANTRRLFETWDSTNMKSFELSSVGIIIGFISQTKSCGFAGDINVWVN